MLKKAFKKSVVLLSLLTLLLCFASLSAFAENNIVATVTVQGGEYREFTSIEKGWVYALEQSLEKPTTIKLCADWIAPDGVFYCTNDKGNEYGTDAGGLYLYDDFDITIDLNGHKIDRNLKEPKYNGFVFYMEDTNAKLTIKDSAGGGKITGGNNSTFDGGAIYVYDGSLYIEGGKITGNHARNGGGIYWYSDDTLCITGGEISGNTATENGGGIYHGGGGQFGSVDQGSIYLGGDVKIYGNSGAGYENNNLYFKDDKRLIYRAAGQTADIPNVPFTDETVIGISAYDKDALISGENSRFNWGDDARFFSDSDKYYVNMVYDATGGDNTYKLYLDSAENKPSPTSSVMAVTVEDGVTMEFTNFGKAWAYALNQSLSKPITVTLLSDWVAENGSFYCTYDGRSEYGSQNGYLYINDDHNITIDLNGHKIDRNLSEATENGVVFQLYDYDAKLTIKDSVGGGKITGANNIGNGGAFLVERGNLYIDGGEITGNKAKQGAGIYANSQNGAFIYIDGGKITNNTADYGAGIYMYEGYLTISGGEISGNTAEYEGGGVYWESDNDMLISGGKISGNSAWRGGGIYMKTDMTINGGEISANSATWGGGIFEGSGKAYLTGGKIINNKASYGGGILWLGNTDMYLGNTITGNVATDFGGGVYIYNTYVNIFTGGSATVSGNSSGLGTDNILLSSSANNFCNGSKCNFDGATDLTTGAKIGVRCLDDVFFTSTLCADECGYDFEDIQYFSSDNPAYRIMAIPNPSDSDHPYEFIILSSKGNTPVMEVTVDDQTYTFCDFGDGWGFALTAAEYGTPTSIKLLKDWVAPDGKFEYNKGSYYGSLYIDDSDVDLTIDLNGYKIDRNLDTATSNGSVFYIESASKITIIDNSQAKSSKITGGNNTGYGGAFYVDYGTLYINDVDITGNTAKYGGAIYIDNLDDAYVYITDCKIYGNTATKDGGAIYSNNGYLYFDGGEITGNKAVNGGGVYWNSSHNYPYFTDGKIYGNTATEIGGGVYAAYGSRLYFGGDIQITENTNGNVYLKDDEGNQTGIHNSCGQDGSPNKPLREGALIGILSSMENDMVSGGGSYFNERDFTYFYSDHSGYYIRSIYNPDIESHPYVFEFTAWDGEEARYPRVKSVSVKNSELIESAEFDYNTQTVTLTAYNTKKNFFERASLYNLIDCTYDKDIYYLYGTGELRDLREVQEYMILSDNDTYVLFTVKVVPSGGEWADEQEDGAIPYAMTVAHGDTKKEFIVPDEGWAYAVSQTDPVTITLFEHWVSAGGQFTGSGAKNGYLYTNNENLDITIDLNGYTIDRGLKSAISDGQVFKIDNGKLTITDSIGTGKITGGNTTGYGGAFWVEYGTLCIKGGEIKDNNAEYGGAIYCNDLDDAFIYIEGGKFIGNKATEDGGAIYMYDGYLDITGGEISGNTAKNGAGIYWESDNAAFLTGGKIINNNATVSGGVYVETNGDVYVGGDVTITGNGNGNLYLYNGARISNAHGQKEGIPNNPLSRSARIGITATEKEEIISEEDSMFNEADFDVMFSDNSGYFIRSAYDADDEGHEHKLYINSWEHEDARYPRVKTVSVKNSDIIEDATIDYDEQIITLKVSVDNKDALKSAALDNLISYTCDNDIYYIDGADKNRDLTTAQKYKTISDNGTYVMVIVEVEWICSEHVDKNEDGICDECNEYSVSESKILDYNAKTQEATVFVTKAGKYTLVFADYENNKLEKADAVEFEFKEGFNIVSQKATDFALANGDKIMLWYDMIEFIPACRALTIK